MADRHPGGVPAVLSEDTARRAAYERLCRSDGRHDPLPGREGGGPHVAFCVYTLDLDEGRGDVYVAAGLGLALEELGWSVSLVGRREWHLIESADVVVGMLPDLDPSLAPPDAWTVAWVRNETDRWARMPHLCGYDQVVASSQLSVDRLRRVCDRAAGVLPIGVDTDLFSPDSPAGGRTRTAVTTAHVWGTLRDVHRAFMALPDDADVVMYGEVRGDPPPELRRWVRPSVSYFALPDAYRRAGLVVDDMNSTTLGYGNLNSRFFESAASGSLPLVNGVLGVRELGLPEVPCYRGDLGRVLRRLRDEPARTAERAVRLCEVVREQHSWRERARRFVDLVEPPRSAGRGAALTRPVHVFPDYSGGNPYQTMLFSRLGETGAYPVTVKDVDRHFSDRVAYGGDPGVLNLHWTNPILQRSGGPASARRDLDRFAAGLRSFKAQGGRLVWTVHNALPHDAVHAELEVELAQLLVAHSDVVHVLSPETLDEVADHYRLDPEKVVMVPHASYRGHYPEWISRRAAREQLDIRPSEKVVLALGGIRPYKGFDRLLEVFEELVAKDPTVRLLVAGDLGRDETTRALGQRCEGMPRVTTSFGRVPADRLQVWMKAADLAVLPYRRVLNSGAFFLAEGFGLPVVVPRRGALRSAGDLAHVRLFAPDDDASLAATLAEALTDLVVDRDGAADARESALATAADRSVEDMAGRFRDLVTPLLPPA